MFWNVNVVGWFFFFSSLLNVSFSCGGKAGCERHTEGGCGPGCGRHTDAFSVPEHREWALGAVHNPSWPRLECAFLSPLPKHCATCMWSPKCSLRFIWGKSLFILVSSHVALENGQCSALHSATIATSFSPHPSSSSWGWEILDAHSLCSYSVFNETFGICKECFVGLSKCKFPCIVMRRAYYSNFCGLHCIGLNFDPVPLWPSFLATSESRPFHPSCVIDPKQECGVNVVSDSWIKP